MIQAKMMCEWTEGVYMSPMNQEPSEEPINAGDTSYTNSLVLFGPDDHPQDDLTKVGQRDVLLAEASGLS